MKMLPARFRRSSLVFLVSSLGAVLSPCLLAQNMSVYTDSLQGTWANWSWATVNFANASPVHSGSASISVVSSGYQALYLHNNTAFNSSPYASLSFWVNGGATGGQPLSVQATTNGTALGSTYTLTAPTGAWQQVTIPLSSLGAANLPSMDGFWIQVNSGTAQPAVYIDDIQFVTNGTTPPSITLTAPVAGSTFAGPTNLALSASVTANGHTITKVQFYNGSTLLGEDATAPYSITWSNVTAGNYSLKARLVYDSGSSLDSSANSITVTGTMSAVIAVDGHINRHAISPGIYGTAFPSGSSQLSDLNFTMSRSGGNAETRYNWLIDAHNRGGDWYFESIADGPGTPNASDDSFVSQAKAGSADALLTMPMIGWVPKLGSGRAHLASFSVAKYGSQQKVDPYWSDAGNGVTTGGANIVNDPNDANFATNSNFQVGWIQHLIATWGSSTNGGVKYYLMDNEHTIWYSTHRDVHPVGPTMQEIRDKIIDYATVVKTNDPNALVCAPEEWGWSGYFNSGYDMQNPGGTDRANNGGWDYCPWLLNQLRIHDQGTGVRLLDYFTLHCYPQEGNVGSDAVDTTTATLRNQTTRVFWDTNYVDPSWINSVIMLIPRMKSWVNAYYPGTKIGITEYNWGAEGNINGATAQADILGIFGREGLDLATRWTTPNTGTPCYNAMKIYRNYDGSKSTFGDTSISASGPNPDNVAVYAATRSSDGALTLMVINKQLTASAALTVNLANVLPGSAAQAWQLTSANTITRVSDVPVSGNSFSTTVPQQSITLFVLPAGSTPPPPVLSAAAMPSDGQFTFNLNATAGQTYIIQGSADLLSWQSLATNTLAGATTNFQFNVSGDMQYFRAQWWP
ncbi:MAG: glycoside hydrolase family 44 protein [Verrucomicrobiota bacterium]